MLQPVTDLFTTELDIAPPSAVRQAAGDFARALAGTPEFQAFEAASHALQQDTDAQAAMDAYQRKVESLRALLMLDAVAPEDQAELDRLRLDFATRPSVAAYSTAEQALAALCQDTANLLSADIGLNFASACGSGCCS